jgi:hypothetical protein
MSIQKNVILILAMLFMALQLFGQDAIDKYFSQYRDDPNFTSIVISSKMFQLFAKLDADSEEGKTALEAMKGLTGIKMISNESHTEGIKGFSNAIAKIGKEYEVLMSVDEKDEKVRFFIREDGTTISELLMVVGGRSKLFVMSISGNIDLEKLSSLSKSMNVGGIDYLKNLDEKQKEK